VRFWVRCRAANCQRAFHVAEVDILEFEMLAGAPPGRRLTCPYCQLVFLYRNNDLIERPDPPVDRGGRLPGIGVHPAL